MKPLNPAEVKILVVEDHPVILLSTARLLQTAGYQVAQASDAEKALQTIGQHRPDLVLLDRHLPGLDGMEVCQRIKREPAWAGILVIMISASYTESPQQAEALESGADGYIIRPIANRELLARIESYVRILTLNRELARQVEELQELIVERARGEAANARLAMAVEQAAETIVITDLQGTILYTNPAFEKTTGYTCAEALGRKPSILKSGQHVPEFYRQMWATLQRGEIWSGHTINRRKEGMIYEEEGTISPVRNQAGSVVNYVAVKRDVTREVRLESQLREAQKMQVVGQLAGGVAHDFNNILAVILLQAELLGSGPGLQHKQREMAREIVDASQRAANITRQLLLFSRRQAMQLRPLNLGPAITGIATMLQRILGETSRLELKLSPLPLTVQADVSMLDQVLVNLTVNSRDAMAAGGRFTIETTAVTFDAAKVAQTQRARPGVFACLRVSDTGTGIEPEIRKHIFEPFFTTKEVGKGSGLGLATVYGIIEQHQGWVNVDSEPGQGTTFRIYLPCTPAVLLPSPAPRLTPIARGGSEMILLAEDEGAVRTTMKIALSRLGYHVLEAASGEQAMELWQEHRSEIRLLVTDLVMAGRMNGKELADQILQQTPHLKIIYASGYSAEIAGQDLQLIEGVNFLSKPFEMKALAQIVRNSLDAE